jgi:16S rRNA (adenine1518-N6/adenine1519-N6)-dimethyltransferase
LDVSLAYQKRLYKSKLRLIGNIPYHLTSPILFKVFEERKVVRDLTIMVQREVARRIVARPGSKEYGITSVLAQFFGEPRIFFDVSPNCFYPKPKVTSSVLHVRLYDALPHRVDAELFRLIVRTAFGKRRKTLRNSLKFLPYDEDTVNRIIQQIDFPTEKRPEQLSVAQFAQLTDQIAQILL